MRVNIKTLIHTALVAEAKPIIGYFHLRCVNKIPFNLYQNNDIVLIASGIGEENTKAAITYALSLYKPRIAINVGVVGCADKDIKIGSLFCATHKNISVSYSSLSSHQSPVSNSQKLNSTLVDQESAAFLRTIPEDVEKYIFKIVLDHLDPIIPSKAKVGGLIQKSLPLWSPYVKRTF